MKPAFQLLASVNKIYGVGKKIAPGINKVTTAIWVGDSFRLLIKHSIKWIRRQSKFVKVATANSLVTDSLEYLMPTQGITVAEVFNGLAWLNPWLFVGVVARGVDIVLSFINMMAYVNLAKDAFLRIRASFGKRVSSPREPLSPIGDHQIEYCETGSKPLDAPYIEFIMQSWNAISEFSDIFVKFRRKLPRFFYLNLFSDIRDLFKIESKLHRLYLGLSVVLAVVTIGFRFSILWNMGKYLLGIGSITDLESVLQKKLGQFSDKGSKQPLSAKEEAQVKTWFEQYRTHFLENGELYMRHLQGEANLSELETINLYLCALAIGRQDDIKKNKLSILERLLIDKRDTLYIESEKPPLRSQEERQVQKALSSYRQHFRKTAVFYGACLEIANTNEPINQQSAIVYHLAFLQGAKDAQLDPTTDRKVQQMMPVLYDQDDRTLADERGIVTQMVKERHPLLFLPLFVSTVGMITGLPKLGKPGLLHFIRPGVPARFLPTYDRVSAYLPGGLYCKEDGVDNGALVKNRMTG